MRVAVVIVSQPEQKRGAVDAAKSLVIYASKRVLLPRDFVQLPPLGQPFIFDTPTIKTIVGSFKNSKNSVENVVFQGSPSDPYRIYLAKPGSGSLCTSVTKVT